MLGKSQAPEKGDLIGFIGKGMFLEGKLSFEDTVRIDGHFKGEINASGTLVVGENGHVEGNINVGSIIITGLVEGVLVAKSRVEIKAPGRMLGEMRTPNLIIGDGAIFEGNCHMVNRSNSEIKEVVNYGG